MKHGRALLPDSLFCHPEHALLPSVLRLFKALRNPFVEYKFAKDLTSLTLAEQRAFKILRKLALHGRHTSDPKFRTV